MVRCIQYLLIASTAFPAACGWFDAGPAEVNDGNEDAEVVDFGEVETILDGIDGNEEPRSDGQDGDQGPEADIVDDTTPPPGRQYEFLPDQTFVIPEDAQAGDTVGEKNLARNYHPAGAVVFEVTGGSGRALFAVDVDSGLLTVAATSGLRDGPDAYGLDLGAHDDVYEDTAQVTVRVLDVDGDAAYFIDPTYSGDGAGTRAQPWSRWADVVWRDGSAYMQRRGTIASADSTVQPAADNVLLGAYGAGARPVIDKVHGDDWGVYIAGRTGVVVRDIELSADTNSATALLYATSSADVTLDNLEVAGSNNDEYNLLRVLAVDNMRILNSYVHDGRDDGLYAQDCSIELAYTFIARVNQNWFIDPDPVVTSGAIAQIVDTHLVGDEGHPGAWVHHNLCDRTDTGNKHGFIIGGGQTDPARLVLEHNVVLGCAQTYGESAQNGLTVHGHPDAIIRYNVVKDTDRGILFDVATHDMHVYYNVFVRTYLWGIQFNDGGDNSQIYNNLFYDFGKGANDLRSAIYTSWTMDLLNNIFYNPEPGVAICGAYGGGRADTNIFYPDEGGFTPGPSSIVGDPGFVDAGQDDFHLAAAGSIAVDAGTDVGLSEDVDGVALIGPPDIGAFEFIP